MRFKKAKAALAAALVAGACVMGVGCQRNRTYDYKTITVYDVLDENRPYQFTYREYNYLIQHIGENEEDQQITVCYLKEPIDMNAPDARHVYVMFVLLTSNSQTHLQVLSQLATLFKEESIKQLLEKHAGQEELVKAIQELL